MINLFVGDNDNLVKQAAMALDPSAFLVDHSNCEEFLSGNCTSVTAFTSFADLPKITKDRSVFYEVLCQADCIYYCPPQVWSDHADHFAWNSQQIMTEYYLYQINRVKHNVQGFVTPSLNKDSWLELVQTRTHQEPVLWVSGCSVANGYGVQAHESFASLVAQAINRPVIRLTRNGTSIAWAADQILRSDIQAGDILIWALTGENRAVKITDSAVDRETDPDLLMDETRLYQALTSVHQVKNFCDKIGCQLIVLPVLCSEQLQLMLHDLAGYYQTPYMPWFLDKGTDNLHPGPAQHQAWADACIKILEDIK